MRPVRQRLELSICGLCGKNVKKVCNHHFPLPKELGGGETIPVCLSCHRRDHRLINQLKREIEKGSIQLDLTGDDPHADRRAAIRVALDRLRNQMTLFG